MKTLIGVLLLGILLTGCSQHTSSDDVELGTGTAIQVNGGTTLQLSDLNHYTGYEEPELSDNNRTMIAMSSSGNIQTLEINYSDLGLSSAGGFDVNLNFSY